MAETTLLSVDTIVPQVYFLSQYGVKSTQQAAELTTILQSILNIGVFASMEEAYKSGIPVGTFVLIDDPETPDKDFSVQVVYATSDSNATDVAIDIPVRNLN